jgi:dephospho-CoA kinase
VRRILLTGMSGVGKSTLVAELAARGHKAVDTDDGYVDVLPDGRQRWREEAVEQLLDTEDAPVLFLAGCQENQVRFHPRFDAIVLLTAPLETLVERLDTRTGNPFGKAPEERARFLADVVEVAPLLRRVADHVVDTRAPLADVVATVLGLSGVDDL